MVYHLYRSDLVCEIDKSELNYNMRDTISIEGRFTAIAEINNRNSKLIV